jgi:hypothetical protein
MVISPATRSMADRLSTLFLMLSFAAARDTSAQTIPAFPGADGAAAQVTGGRGGVVYHVTKLDRNSNHNEPGTLRYGLTDSNFTVGGQVQPRTIVFDVAGTFWLGRFGAERNHNNGWDTTSRLNLGSNVTIAGQTAPGPVYIMGGLVKAGGNNVVLRNVTIAPGYGMRTFEKPDENPPELPQAGDFPDSYVYDAIDITGTNVMIDHVSTFYATDETISANEQANNITIQYSNISQGQNYPQADAEASGVTYTGHALGSLLQGGSNSKFSLHHNLYAHQKGRLPRVGSEVGSGAYNDFRNNVFYNWLGTGGSGAGGQPSFNNFVGNFWLAGPGGENPVGGSSTAVGSAAGGTGIFNGSNASGTRVHHSGNVKDTNKNGTPQFATALANSDFGSSNFQANPQWYQDRTTYTGITDTAATAYDRVLRYMGSRWWTRDYDYLLNNIAAIDTVDERLIHETATGTGKIKAWADDPFNNDPNEGAEWRSLLALRANTTTGAAPFNHPADWDTDFDGMPDHWEKPHGLNPSVHDHNSDFDTDGYTNLEEYINEIAEWPAPQPIAFSGNTNNRYAQLSNWDIGWQPTKYDEVQIRSGTAVVDAPGQHAGTLVIAPNHSDMAQLNIIDGWLRAASAVAIGGTSSANGTLNLNGGSLATARLEMGDASQFNFVGGRLQADLVNFDLVVRGGTVVGETAGTTINGDFEIESGAVHIELASATSFGIVSAEGHVTLGGELRVRLLGEFEPEPDDVFAIIDGQSIGGSFTNLNEESRIQVDGAAGSFLVTVAPTQVLLSGFLDATTLPGDYNSDGIVGAADYVVWRRSLGETGPKLPADGNGNHEIDIGDYDVWRANYGQATANGSLNALNLPEPQNAASLLILISAMFGRYR